MNSLTLVVLAIALGQSPQMQAAAINAAKIPSFKTSTIRCHA